MSNSMLNSGSQQYSGITSVIASAISGSGGNQRAAYDNIVNSNSELAKFLRDNANKTPEQVAAENGVDIGVARGVLGSIFGM
ncbi:MAG: hypothetical protein IKF14_18400 [Atopobiaceae bacterium]|nr:hypothetical protein [Atopobiaceae bacterium]MBR3161061.1 hypothetical protein [Atopobiaceae bacterium]